jgi:hypothetical protein
VGIALMGSIATSAYRSGIDLEAVRLPAGSRAAAEESIGAADAIASRIPDGGALTAQATSAFTDAFTFVNTLSLGVALAAAAAVLVVGRRRRREPAIDEIEDEAADLGLELARVPVVEARE